MVCTLFQAKKRKKVAEHLTMAGYSVYCPLHKVRRKWSDRVKTVEEPLFRNYVFIQIDDVKRDEVFAYPGTVRHLFWLRRPAVVRQSEIAIIQKWLGIRIMRILIFLSSCLEITCGSPLDNSRAKRPNFWTEQILELLSSSKN